MDRKILISAVIGLIALGVLARIVPHLPNAAPITAIALVGSLYLGKRWSVVLPLVVLFVSDLHLGFYDWRIMASVYASFALIGMLTWLCRTYQNSASTMAVIIGSPLLFFLITNAAVWLFSPWYAKDLSGLLYSYELGLPFLRNMAVGDVFYIILLVGGIESVRALRCKKIKFPTRRACAQPIDTGL